MATLKQRLSDFASEGVPPVGEPLELLCQDHIGTYMLPFACQWRDEAWQNERGERIEATVIGWRMFRSQN